MGIAYDPAKSERNARERGSSFDRGYDFDFDRAVSKEDERFAYPERRVIATAFVESRLHVPCWTPTVNGIRVISFRKANDREIRKYEQEVS
ncbi:BrnT family toxin [Bosea sp. CS1GBMeth4]|uniref:BrnT family toxin n=1 Tax=Bosea sp. CS1GBMeth4 TaxID=1892849 RepID=UPI001644A527|nr:BrnT family toxin [Bosea sp. CS1GBMeth4]